MAPTTELSHLVNPLATLTQLETSSSQLDGIPKDLEDSIRFATFRLMQAAGTLLRLPQEIIAQSIVLLQRYWLGADGGSLLDNDTQVVAAAALYLAAKPSPSPISPRQLLTVLSYLGETGIDGTAGLDGREETLSTWQLPDSQYEVQRNSIYAIEADILRVLGFQTEVALPYILCINYLQTLEVFQTSEGSALARSAFAYLNSALLSPQMLYLTHQPTAIATASIYLAAREVGAKLPETEWWEVFDVDREELGFLVVALLSVESYAAREGQTWAGKQVPQTVNALQANIARRRNLEAEA